VVLVEKWKEGSKWVLLLLLLSSLGPISPINLLQLEFLNLCFLHRLRWDVCSVWFLIVQFYLIFFPYLHFMLHMNDFAVFYIGFVVLIWIMVCDLTFDVSLNNISSPPSSFCYDSGVGERVSAFWSKWENCKWVVELKYWYSRLLYSSFATLLSSFVNFM